MLRIAKVRPGGEAYYFRTLGAASGAARLIEPDPLWIGSGCSSLGLSGVAGRRSVRLLLDARDPATGKVLPGADRSRVGIAAFDITLSVPKSVSVVHALAAPERAVALWRAHDSAVSATVGYLERNALFAPRRRGADRWQVPVDGALAAGFPHRTSRANDPHLHTHVLLANLAFGADGRWSAVSSRTLYGHLRPAQAVFEAHLRAELTRAGIELGPLRGLFADIATIERDALREFSRRSVQIERAMAEEGLRGSEASALLAEATRPPKDVSSSYEELRQQWRERGYRVGLSARRIDLAAGAGRSRSEAGRAPSLEEALARLASPFDGTFSLGDLVVARCASLQRGARAEEVEAEVSGLVAGGAVIRLGDRYASAVARRSFQAAADRLARAAEASAASVLAYPAGERLAALDSLSAMAATACGSGRRAVGLAAGARAALCFEAATGIETAPVQLRAGLEGSLGQGDLVVLADCGSLTEAELRDVMESCASVGAAPVLFGASRAIGRSRLLDVLVHRRPAAPSVGARSEPPGCELSPAQVVDAAPLLRVVAAPDATTARRTALSLAARALPLRSPRGDGVLVVVPERCYVAEMGPAAPPGCQVVEARRARQQLGSSALGAPGLRPGTLVVVGGARLLGSAARLSGVRRTHVVTVAGGAPREVAGRLAEAAAPRRLVTRLGTPGRDLRERSRWREAALAVERGEERRLDGPVRSRDGPGLSLSR